MNKEKPKAPNPRGRAPLPAVERAKKADGWLTVAGASKRAKVSTHMIRRWAAGIGGLVGSEWDGPNLWIKAADVDEMIRKRKGA